jgi:hypothetical protein
MIFGHGYCSSTWVSGVHGRSGCNASATLVESIGCQADDHEIQHLTQSFVNKQFGGVAQRLEQRLHKPRVGGSIPPAAT